MSEIYLNILAGIGLLFLVGYGSNAFLEISYKVLDKLAGWLVFLRYLTYYAYDYEGRKRAKARYESGKREDQLVFEDDNPEVDP